MSHFRMYDEQTTFAKLLRLDIYSNFYLIEAIIESKLLDLNQDKSCYIVIGRGKSLQQIKSARPYCMVDILKVSLELAARQT